MYALARAAGARVGHASSLPGERVEIRRHVAHLLRFGCATAVRMCNRKGSAPALAEVGTVQVFGNR